SWNPLPTSTSKLLLPRREDKYHSGENKKGHKKNKKKRVKRIKTTNYALPINSQAATDFEREFDRQLREDLERELAHINKEKFAKGKKSRINGASNQRAGGISKSWGKTGGRKHRMDMNADPKFAMELEVVRTKKLREAINRASPNRRNKERLHKKYGRTTSFGLFAVPLSSARMVSRGNRMVEERISMIGGQKVTVDLSNPALHGADLIINPGAVINDLFESTPMKTDQR
ncbi:hypothetical protein PFISCL1PPCAC_19480, partial [Pristionchus fissidentatus]